MKNIIKNFIIFSFVFSWLFFGLLDEKPQAAEPTSQDNDVSGVTTPQVTNSSQLTETAADTLTSLEEAAESVQSESSETEALLELEKSGIIIPEQASDSIIATEEQGNKEIVGDTSTESPVVPEVEQIEPAEPNEQAEKIKKMEPVQEVQPGEVNLKVFNKGESKSGANKVKELLADKGYLKMETGEGKGKNIVQTLIFFNEEKFRIPAQNLRELLIQEEKIYSAVMIAETDEEKSADIVIMLGKFKEAPPN